MEIMTHFESRPVSPPKPPNYQSTCTKSLKEPNGDRSEPQMIDGDHQERFSLKPHKNLGSGNMKFFGKFQVISPINNSRELHYLREKR